MGDECSTTEVFPQPPCEHFIFITFPITVKKILGRGSNLKEEILHYGGSAWLQSMGCLVSYITLVVKKQSDDMGRVEDVNLSPVTVTPLQSVSSS